MAFSASEAAFEGFRIVRREPGSVLAWAVLQLLLGLAVTALMLPALNSMRAATAVSQGQPVSAAAALSAAGRFFGTTLIMLPLELVVFAVLSAAVYRAVLRPNDKGVGRLRFGADELRLMGVWVLLGLLMFVLVLGLAIVAGLVGAGVYAAAAKSRAPAGLIVFVLYLAFIAAMVWLSVRFSLAGPMTFASRKIQLFSSWRLTKGRFWSLLGCYLLAFIFVLLLEIVFVVLEVAIAVGSSGGSLMAAATSLFRPEFTSLHAYFTPARIAMLPVGAALGAVLWAIGVAPAARAYKDIAGLSPDARAEAFS